MEIEVIKKIIEEHTKDLTKRNETINQAELYYKNENDILRTKNPLDDEQKLKDEPNPLRNADNRVSHAWHRLLVNQKASYTMTTPPGFDTDDREMNTEITKLLGDGYPKVAKNLCIAASNAGVAWLHVWRDETNGFFRYAVVDSKQIIPIYSKRLTNDLEGVLRIYEDYDDNAETIIVYEFWNDKEVQMYSRPKKKGLDELERMNHFTVYDIGTDEAIGNTNTYSHEWGEVPFIPFRNSNDEQSDLKMNKSLIDVYDKVYSGFINDLDDVQEIIFVLTNYSGENKREFLEDLNTYKMVKLENDGDEQSGVDTLAIDIPTEAREKALEVTRESIFVLGQGVDPQKNISQNNSGVALKHMYSLLELKASEMEAEFRESFAKLTRFILKYFGKDPDIEITQTWTRSSINNDLEQAEVVAKLSPVSSDETIAKSNPLVENWEDELAKQKEENADNFRMEDDYRPDDKDDEVDDET